VPCCSCDKTKQTKGDPAMTNLILVALIGALTFFGSIANAEKPGSGEEPPAAGWLGVTSAVSRGVGPVTHTRMCAAEFGPLAHVCTTEEIHKYAAQLTSPGGWITATRIEDGGFDPVSGYGGFGVNSCAAHLGGDSTEHGLRVLVDESAGGGPITAIRTEGCANEHPVACCSD
jgi:hypothetical protein